VLVPLAGAGTRGDQVDNAALFEERGAAISLAGDRATPENLLSAIFGFLDDPAGHRAASLAAGELAGADAAGDTADLILNLLGELR